MEYVLFVIMLVPVLYVIANFSDATIAHERAAVDDSKCAPGFTNYPGPM